MGRKTSRIVAFIVTGWLGVQFALAAAAPAPALPVFDRLNPPRGTFADNWYAVMMSSNKIGHAHIAMTRISTNATDMIETRTQMRLAPRRGNAKVEAAVDSWTLETLEGLPMAFKRTMTLGKQPVVMQGIITNGKVKMSAEQYGQKIHIPRFDYPAGALMEWGLERELVRHGLKVGMKYELLSYDPLASQDKAIKTAVEVPSLDMVDLFGRQVEAFRVRSKLYLPKTDGPARPIEGESWMTADTFTTVRMIQSVCDIPVEMRLCTKTIAMSKNDLMDILDNALVQLSGPIDEKHAGQVTYRIGIKPGRGERTLGAIPETAMQRVISHTNDVATVVVIRGPAPAQSSGALDPEERRRCLACSPAINYKDPKIVQLAGDAAGGETNQMALAEKLSRFVSQYISTKNFNVGFATASEVAVSHEGDCTEHGILLAALARACGIPSRVVMGLAYAETFGGKPNVMVGHMWAQLWIDGRWVDVDAALRRHTQVDPAHIALNVSACDTMSFADMFSEILLSLGRLDVQVVDVKQ